MGWFLLTVYSLIIFGWLAINQRAWRCDHSEVRCIHGDEVWSRMDWRGRIFRLACLKCGSAVSGGLPEICSSTGEAHGGMKP